MNPVTFIVLWTIIWWVTFFIVLPIGLVAEETPEKGHASSAPKKHFLVRKIILTTIISLLSTILFYYLQQSGYFAGWI